MGFILHHTFHHATAPDNNSNTLEESYVGDTCSVNGDSPKEADSLETDYGSVNSEGVICSINITCSRGRDCSAKKIVSHQEDDVSVTDDGPGEDDHSITVNDPGEDDD